MKLQKWLLKAPALLRTISAGLVAVAGVASVVPAIAPYAEYLAQAAAWIGGLGIARAVVRTSVEE